MSLNPLNLRLSNGITLAVPPSLQTMTTYIVLEQETWFEKELGFLAYLLKPGMTVIDIGANMGIYSLTMAQLVAPGRAYAYEPGSEARALLKTSRDLNRLSNLEVIPLALSDSVREGHLDFGSSSELNRLADAGPGERVEITSLDFEDQKRGWQELDFVKIDAEGEEERVLAGGRSFFTRHSPVVMFEIKAADKANGTLPSMFISLGYRLFRLLVGMPVLVPVEVGDTLDDYELNLFAAKPSRAHALAQQGLLVEHRVDWRPNAHASRCGLSLLLSLPFAAEFKTLWKGGDGLEPDYCDALAAYETWRSTDVPLPERCAALDSARRKLVVLCNRCANSARLSTLARVAWESGKRGLALQALFKLADEIQRGSLELFEPFWPASKHFDAIMPNGAAGIWFISSVLQQLEQVRAYSSFFGEQPLGLDWLCQQPFASIEMERRRALMAVRAGRQVDISERLRTAALDHLNAEIWRSGFRWAS